jgi:AcrR family transcriptional regulator
MSTRRDRLRAAAAQEILAAARAQLRSGGPTGMSLRAIGREVGVTAAALYRYFTNLDALVDALRAQFFDDARAALELARDSAGAERAARFLAVCRELRRWALANSAEYALMYGTVGVPAGRTAGGAAEAALAAVFTGELADPGSARAMVYWGRLCGLVAMEVFGHLRFAMDDGDDLFAAEVASMAGEWRRSAPVATPHCRGIVGNQP